MTSAKSIAGWVLLAAMQRIAEDDTIPGFDPSLRYAPVTAWTFPVHEGQGR